MSSTVKKLVPMPPLPAAVLGGGCGR